MVENKGKDKAFNWIMIALMAVYAFVTLLPLLHVLANSFSAPELVNKGQIGIFPKGFTLAGYRKAFQEESIFTGFANTLVYTFFGTIIQLVLQFCAAYPLSRRDLKGKGFFNIFFALTMFIQGGLIPTFLVVKMLGMLNTPLAMIIPGCVGIYNIIIIRTYMSTAIPWELQEAAMIDGSGNIRIFLQIVLPLSLPIVAVMTLYAIVGYWNSYFNSLMYLTNDRYFPLQRVLQGILVSNESHVGGGTGSVEQGIMAESLKYVTIIISSAPILLLYPFFERFFEKGLMIGGVKG